MTTASDCSRAHREKGFSSKKKKTKPAFWKAQIVRRKHQRLAGASSVGTV